MWYASQTKPGFNMKKKRFSWTESFTNEFVAIGPWKWWHVQSFLFYCSFSIRLRSNQETSITHVHILGTIHKRHRNISGGVEGLKFRCCKILEGRSWVNQGQNSDMGEGGIKNCQKIPTSFMDGPFCCRRMETWTNQNIGQAHWNMILR